MQPDWPKAWRAHVRCRPFCSSSRSRPVRGPSSDIMNYDCVIVAHSSRGEKKDTSLSKRSTFPSSALLLPASGRFADVSSDSTSCLSVRDYLRASITMKVLTVWKRCAIWAVQRDAPFMSWRCRFCARSCVSMAGLRVGLAFLCKSTGIYIYICMMARLHLN